MGLNALFMQNYFYVAIMELIFSLTLYISITICTTIIIHHCSKLSNSLTSKKKTDFLQYKMTDLELNNDNKNISFKIFC